MDTNMCIYLMRQQPAAVGQRFAALRRGDVGMSVVTLAELRYGVESRETERQRNESALAALLEDIPAEPFDSLAAERYGIIRAAVRERRRDALDRLIAAHSISAGVVLVTNNPRDFQGCPGLRLENWVA